MCTLFLSLPLSSTLVLCHHAGKAIKLLFRSADLHYSETGEVRQQIEMGDLSHSLLEHVPVVLGSTKPFAVEATLMCFKLLGLGGADAHSSMEKLQAHLSNRYFPKILTLFLFV
jgi:hypothetical protein